MYLPNVLDGIHLSDNVPMVRHPLRLKYLGNAWKESASESSPIPMAFSSMGIVSTTTRATLTGTETTYHLRLKKRS